MRLLKIWNFNDLYASLQKDDKQTQINAEIRRFFSLQEERSLTYSIFDEYVF